MNILRFDEYKNYYNSHGEPCDPPKPEDLYEYDEKEYGKETINKK